MWGTSERGMRFLSSWCCGRHFRSCSFSFSGSKLPGYILPSIPPLAILTGDYLYRMRRQRAADLAAGDPCHDLTGFLTFVLLLCPQYMVYERD